MDTKVPDLNVETLEKVCRWDKLARVLKPDLPHRSYGQKGSDLIRMSIKYWVLWEKGNSQPSTRLSETGRSVVLPLTRAFDREIRFLSPMH